MSLSHKTGVYERPIQNADRKHPEYSFILVLVCIALALVLARTIFAPASIGSGISNDISLVGP